MEKNRHGLSRDIPAPVQRDIRQRCGFGCVICGCAIYEYEHVDPPFSDAEEHDPSKMTLLCGSCHSRVTRGILSKTSVKKAMIQPKCLQTGFSFGPFDISGDRVEVFLAATRWINPKAVIEINGVPLFNVEPPEVQGGPFRISATFYDRNGAEIFKIDRNEWQGNIENWDIELKGAVITVRCAPRDIILKLRSEPPYRIFVERLEMFYEQSKVIIEGNNRLLIISPDSSVIQWSGGNFSGTECKAGISITNNGIGFANGCQSIGGYELCNGEYRDTNTIRFGG